MSATWYIDSGTVFEKIDGNCSALSSLRFVVSEIADLFAQQTRTHMLGAECLDACLTGQNACFFPGNVVPSRREIAVGGGIGRRDLIIRFDVPFRGKALFHTSPVFRCELTALAVGRSGGPSGVLVGVPTGLDQSAPMEFADEFTEFVMRRNGSCEWRRIGKLQVKRDQLCARDIAGVQCSGDGTQARGWFVGDDNKFYCAVLSRSPSLSSSRKRGPICGRPPSRKRLSAGFDRIGCDHMSGLFLRSQLTAGPDGFRDAR
ncbi:MAG TPA: hypothetical protein VII49_02850, partial [Rhizomicrobium sp.]